MTEVRTRIAPAPSGSIHVGNARTALYNWLFARRHDGTFILRIEDTDAKRATDDAYAAVLEDLRWLGLRWDEGPENGGSLGPYRQSERMERYDAAAQDLVARGHAYWCYCTAEELADRRKQAMSARKTPGYDVVKDDRPIGRYREAHRELTAFRLECSSFLGGEVPAPAVVTRGLAGRHRLFASLRKLFRGAVAPVCMPADNEILRGCLIALQAFALTIGTEAAARLGAFVPLQTKPPEVLQDRGIRVVRRALRIGVLDPEDERPTVTASEQPVVQGGARVAYVDRAAGGQRDPSPDLIHGSHPTYAIVGYVTDVTESSSIPLRLASCRSERSRNDGQPRGVRSFAFEGPKALPGCLARDGAGPYGLHHLCCSSSDVLGRAGNDRGHRRA